MKEALDKTMMFLAVTRNQAAVPLLVSALSSRLPAIREGAIRALVERRGAAGHTQLLHRFPAFHERELAALTDALRHTPHHMKQALQDAILAEQVELCESACHVILLGRIYEVMNTLISVAENCIHRHSAQAAATLVRLAQLLQQEISGDGHSRSCDPFFARRQIMQPLERAVMRYGEHRRLEIIDTFLLLVPPTNPTLLSILADPRQRPYQPIVDSLSTSAVPALMDLLTQLLHDIKAPEAALEIVGKRRDRKFLDHLLHHVGTPVSLRVLENMRRLTSLSWFGPGRDVLLEVDGPAQSVAVELASAANIDRTALFDLLKYLLKQAKPEGRRAACDAMIRFPHAVADQCVYEAMRDTDPNVRAASVRQLRRRQFPNAMETLVALLDDPATPVRDAARSSLAEFNFTRYRASFDSLDEKTRRSSGNLVRKVDPSAGRRLTEMLTSPSLSTKLSGLEMVIAMVAADVVCDQLIRLLEDADLAVRTDAANALGLATRPEALAALKEAERDPSHLVREAAERSIEMFGDQHTAAAGSRKTRRRGQF